jgi:hypothetical protein
VTLEVKIKNLGQTAQKNSKNMETLPIENEILKY